MFSERSRLDPSPNWLAEAVARQRRSGRALLDLTASNPTSVGLGWSDAALAECLASEGQSRYEPEPFGSWRARQALSRQPGIAAPDTTPDDVVLTASTSEAYSHLFKLLCDPGDAVLVPEPSYPLLDHLARLEGVRLVTYPLAYDGAWHVDTERLLASKSARCRAVIVVSPNNPTGSFLKREEHSAMERLELPIIVDEVFAAYALGRDPRRANLDRVGSGLLFRLGGLSKFAALPQLKLSWTVVSGPAALKRAALERWEVIADSFLSPSSAPQLALPRLLAGAEPVRREILRRCSSNLQCLESALADAPVSVLRVEGGWYACLRLPAIATEDDYARALLEQDGVLVQPGWLYDFAFGPLLVVSLLTPAAVLQDGVGRLRARVAQMLRAP